MNQALAIRPGELDTYYEQISRVPLLSQEEERDLAIRYFEHRDLEAAQQLVTANLRCVVKLAHEFKRYGCALADLVQEGSLGLMLAVRKYNPYKAYRLISYAVWWIKAMMRQVVQRRALSEDPPSLAELGREMGVSRERVRQIEASGLRKVREYFQSESLARELVA